MRSFFKNNLILFAAYLSLVFIALHFIITYGKIAVHIYLNQFVGNTILDQLFFYITYLGDGFIAPFILLVVLFVNIRTSIATGLALISASITTQILKNQFYDHVNRPLFVFDWTLYQPLKLVAGTDVHIHNSFPSGHSTQVFAIFMSLALSSSKLWQKLLFLLFSVLAAFSRVYLSQHWLIDITVGSLIGTGAAVIFYFAIARPKYDKWNLPLLHVKRSRDAAEK